MIECFGRNVGSSRKAKGLQETSNWWRIDHGNHSRCRFTYESFGSGETKEEAWAQARATVENLK